MANFQYVQSIPYLNLVEAQPKLTVQNLTKGQEARIDLTNYYANKPIKMVPEVIDNVFNAREIIANDKAADITPPKFGVLGHLDPSRVYLFDALESIKKLRSELSLDSESLLLKKVKDLFQEVHDIQASLDLESNSINVSPSFWQQFVKKSEKIFEVRYKLSADDSNETVVSDKQTNKLDSDFSKVPSVYTTALFDTAKNFKDDIRSVDRLHNLLMDLQRDLSHTITRKKNQLIKLEAEIPIAQRNLANLNQQRIKAMGEYQMVVSLVAEDWARVEQEYIRRERILTNHSGLYFVRVQETPFNRLSVVDRSLRYGRIEDLVPATAISQDELPEDLEDYIEAIVDIPIANWKVFENSWHLLPAPNTINKLLEQRKLRLTYLSQKNRKASSSKFVPILQVHQALLQDYARFDFFQEISLQAFNRRAADILSLEDLLGGAPHQLRGKAQNFRNQLDQATHALLAKLQNIKPGIRMAWATAAEVDQLDLQNPHLWPNLREEQDEDIDNIRSLFELINWWWRQLAPNASSAAVTALRNLLRATLMVAVGDDPKEMLHGFLQAIPAQFKLGDLLRAKLNRHAPIGTQLQLVNEKNELIGKLRVEDADDNGSLVSLTQLIKQDVIHSSAQFTVVGIKTQGRSFV